MSIISRAQQLYLQGKYPEGMKKKLAPKMQDKDKAVKVTKTDAKKKKS